MGFFTKKNEAEAVIKVNYKGDNAKKGLSSLQKSIVTLVSAAAIRQLALYTKQLADLGAKAESVAKNFKNFAERSGRDADEMTAKLRAATLGMVNDMELQQRAMQAMVSGVNFDDIVVAMEFVTKFASATGTDVSAKMMTTMTGLARGSAQFLDDIGIQVIGSKDVVNDAIAQMKEKMDQFTTSGEDVAVKAVKMKANFENMRIEIGKKLVPAWEALLDVSNKWIESQVSPELTEINREIKNTELAIRGLVYSSALGPTVFEKLTATMDKAFGGAGIRTRKSIEATLLTAKSALDVLKQKRKELEEGGVGEDPLKSVFIEQKQRRDKERKTASAEDKKAADKAEKQKIKDAKKAAKELAEFWRDNGRNRIAIEEAIAEELLAAKEDAYNETIQLDDDLAEAEAGRERERFENQVSVNREYNVLLYGEKRVAYEERQQELIRQLERELITEETFLKARELVNKEYNEKVRDDKQKTSEQTMSAVSSINSALSSMNDARVQRELKDLETLNLSEAEYAKRKEQIQNESLEKQRRFARVQQAVAIAQATSNVIQAATAVYATEFGGIITKSLAMGAALVQGYAQVSKLQAQHFQAGRKPREQGTNRDEIIGVFNERESIIPAPQTDMHRDEINSIIDNTANTVAGRSGGRGATVVNNFYGVSTEQMLQAKKETDRYNLQGMRI